MTYRLTAAGGDVQDFRTAEHALTEAGKLLDFGASWVRIDVIEQENA